MKNQERKKKYSPMREFLYESKEYKSSKLHLNLRRNPSISRGKVSAPPEKRDGPNDPIPLARTILKKFKSHHEPVGLSLNNSDHQYQHYYIYIYICKHYCIFKKHIVSFYGNPSRRGDELTSLI